MWCGRRLAPAAAERGYELLGVWENGFRHITNNLRTIVGPSDLAGIKLRTPRGRWRVRLFQTFGANPTPMSLAETFIALQTGVIDGQENPLSQIHSQRFHEVQQFLTLTGHVYTPAYLMAGRDHWRTLPSEVRAIVRETAEEVQPFVYEQAEMLDERLLADLRAEGIAVNECDRELFLAARTAAVRTVRPGCPAGQGHDRAFACPGLGRTVILAAWRWVGLRAALGRVLEAAVVGLIATLAAVVVVVGVASRKAGYSLVWYDEVAAILLAWLTYYGAALAALRGAHLGFPNFAQRASAPVRRAMFAARELVVLSFFGLAAWMGGKLLAVLGGTFLVSLPWLPAQIVYSAIPVGALLFMAAEVSWAVEAWGKDDPA